MKKNLKLILLLLLLNFQMGMELVAAPKEKKKSSNIYKIAAIGGVVAVVTALGVYFFKAKDLDEIAPDAPPKKTKDGKKDDAGGEKDDPEKKRKADLLKELKERLKERNTDKERNKKEEKQETYKVYLYDGDEVVLEKVVATKEDIIKEMRQARANNMQYFGYLISGEKCGGIAFDDHHLPEELTEELENRYERIIGLW